MHAAATRERQLQELSEVDVARAASSSNNNAAETSPGSAAAAAGDPSSDALPRLQSPRGSIDSSSTLDSLPIARRGARAGAPQRRALAVVTPIRGASNRVASPGWREQIPRALPGGVDAFETPPFARDATGRDLYSGIDPEVVRGLWGFSTKPTQTGASALRSGAFGELRERQPPPSDLPPVNPEVAEKGTSALEDVRVCVLLVFEEFPDLDLSKLLRGLLVRFLISLEEGARVARA